MAARAPRIFHGHLEGLGRTRRGRSMRASTPRTCLPGSPDRGPVPGTRSSAAAIPAAPTSSVPRSTTTSSGEASRASPRCRGIATASGQGSPPRPSAEPLRPDRRGLHHRLDLGAGGRRGSGARAAAGASLARSLRCAATGRIRASPVAQPPDAPRRAMVPRVPEVRRSLEGAAALESRPRPAPVISGHGRAWLCRRARLGRCLRMRVRMHPSPTRAKRPP